MYMKYIIIFILMITNVHGCIPMGSKGCASQHLGCCGGGACEVLTDICCISINSPCTNDVECCSGALCDERTKKCCLHPGVGCITSEYCCDACQDSICCIDVGASCVKNVTGCCHGAACLSGVCEICASGVVCGTTCCPFGHGCQAGKCVCIPSLVCKNNDQCKSKSFGGPGQCMDGCCSYT